MTGILTYLMLGALGGTLIVLIFGIINLLSREKQSFEKSQNLMRWRVMIQGVALALFTLLLIFHKP